MAAALAAAVLMVQPVAAASLKETAGDQVEKATTQLEVRALAWCCASSADWASAAAMHVQKIIVSFHHKIPACLVAGVPRYPLECMTAGMAHRVREPAGACLHSASLPGGGDASLCWQTGLRFQLSGFPSCHSITQHKSYGSCCSLRSCQSTLQPTGRGPPLEVWLLTSCCSRLSGKLELAVAIVHVGHSPILQILTCGA